LDESKLPIGYPDCLHLNVFAPNDTVSTYPVLVFVHGGLFLEGSAKQLGLHGIVDNLVSRGIVVVTLQYRLGSFGFYKVATRSPTEKGRSVRGLWDIITVLRMSSASSIPLSVASKVCQEGGE